MRTKKYEKGAGLYICLCRRGARGSALGEKGRGGKRKASGGKCRGPAHRPSHPLARAVQLQTRHACKPKNHLAGLDLRYWMQLA